MSRDRWQDRQDNNDKQDNDSQDDSSQAAEPDERRAMDLDDDRMWSAARRTPLSADALQRIAVRAKMSRQPRLTAARWRVWAAASLLLLIGGAAGAAVATFVIKRPIMSGLTDAEGKRARAWTQPPRNRSRAEAPSQTPPDAVSPSPAAAVAEPAAPPVAAAPKESSRPAVAVAATVPAGSTKKAASAQKYSAPGQLAMRGATVSGPVQQVAPMPKLAPPPQVAPPATMPPAPALSPPTGAGAEARILRSALTAVHRQDDPSTALALLDQYDALFPKGTLRAEAMLARAYSLRRLGRDDELLRLLERMPFADMPRAAELRVLLGELLMTRARYVEAAKDFEATLAAGASEGLVERALFGRASCRSHLGDVQGARADLTRYLERFPASSRAAEVRATLAR
jgi:hypothetical protein